ncbi:MAG: hypothetical protein ACTSP9_08795 [Promethearchaeota archaeon]
MSEKEFIEDDIDWIMNYKIPITANSFKGLWVLSALFSRKKPKRMEKSSISSEQRQIEIKVEAKKLETIEV